MNRLEEKTLAFMKQMEHLYLEERDMDAVLSQLDPGIHWIGTGERDICQGIDEARQQLREEAQGLPNHFTVLTSDYQIQQIGDNICIVHGFLTVSECRDGNDMPPVDMRLSALCREEGRKGMVIQSLHLSQASLFQGEGEYFPRKLEGADTDTLKSLIEEQAASLRDKIRNMNALTDNLPGGVMCCDASKNLNLLQYSEGFSKLFGYTTEEIREKFNNCFASMIYPPDLPQTWREVNRQLENSNTKEIEYRVRHKNGKLLTILDKGQLVVDTQGNKMFYCILMDVTESRRAVEALRLSLERYRIIMDQTTDILFEWDIFKDTLLFSNNWNKKFGYEPITKNIKREIISSGHCHPGDRMILQNIMSNILLEQTYSEGEIRIMKHDGNYIWCRIRVTPQMDDRGVLTRAVGVIIDIDAQKKTTQDLINQAERDGLTGIYNKGATQRHSEHYLRSASLDQMCAFMIIDVDNFKMINDIYGHLSGDTILMDIATALRGMFRESDVVGRVGGDEFAVLMRDLTDLDIVEEKARKILDLLRHMGNWKNSDVRLSASIGIAMAPANGNSYLNVFRCADLALYYAKSQGKDKYAFYTTFMTMENTGEEKRKRRKADGKGQGAAFNIKTWISDYVFHTLYQSADFEEVLPTIIEIIGRQFDVSRVYVFEDTLDNVYCSNTFEWCGEGVAPQIGTLQKLRYSDIADDYSSYFDENGIFYCKDVRTLPAKTRKVLERQDIKSLLQCEIKDNGKSRGFVGFDECRNNRFWTQDQIDALSMVAEIIGVFLIKNRAQNKNIHLIESLKAALDYQDCWIYVIEKHTYRILYANAKTCELLPGINDSCICYQLFFNKSRPCADCALPEISKTEKYEKSMFSQVANQMIKMRVNPITWAGGMEAFLVTAKPEE